MNLMKALLPSTILTLIISALVGHRGSAGGLLNLQEAVIGGYAFYWSWTLFFTAMAINGGLVLAIAARQNATSEPAARADPQSAGAGGPHE